MISYSSGKIGYTRLLNTKFEDMIYYIAFIAYSYSCAFGFTTAESLLGLPISALICSLLFGIKNLPSKNERFLLGIFFSYCCNWFYFMEMLWGELLSMACIIRALWFGR